MKANEVTAAMLRRMSATDRERVLRSGIGPVAQIAPDRAPEPPPDGWRARLNPDPPRRLPGQSEHGMQAALFEWAATLAARRDLAHLRLLFAVPNAARMSEAAGRYMAAEGRKPGVPDVFLPVPRAGFCGAVVECKMHPGTVSPDQETWLDALQAAGWRCCVAYSFEEATAFLLSYLSTNGQQIDVDGKNFLSVP